MKFNWQNYNWHFLILGLAILYMVSQGTYQAIKQNDLIYIKVRVGGDLISGGTRSS